MSLRIITVGDDTDHGGKVISGSPNHRTYSVDNKAVAVDGCMTACGCKLIGSVTATVG